MKRLLSFALFCMFFLTSAPPALAYDMEVQCSTTKCTVSSHDPLFSPGVNWIPEKTVERSIIIKNTEGAGKEIYLKIIPGDQTGQLDNYMKLTLSEETGPEIWSGTLAELFTLGTVPLKTLPSHTSFPLILRASMDQNTPNTLQGTSSTFDFGFGYVQNSSDETTADDTPAENTPDNTDNSAVSGSNSQDKSENMLTDILRGASTIFRGESTDTASSEAVLGEQDSFFPGVAGTTDEASVSCTEHPFWWGLLILETVLLIATSFIRSVSGKILLRGLIPLVFIGLLFLLVCNKWLSYTALIPMLMVFFEIFRLHIARQRLVTSA